MIGPEPAPGRRPIADLYDLCATAYDDDPNQTRDVAAAALRSADLHRAGDVLELGCGTGTNTAWLAPTARRVVAVDVSDGMLRRARARAAAPNVAFLRHDIREPFPFADRRFDLAIIMLVLEHVPDIAPVLAECARVLRAPGTLFLCEYHPYRQLRGGQARFRNAGDAAEVKVPAFLHRTADFVNAGIAAGLRLESLRELAEAGAAEGAPPQVLALRFGPASWKRTRGAPTSGS
jgi:SAM-dependent methyltransferase